MARMTLCAIVFIFLSLANGRPNDPNANAPVPGEPHINEWKLAWRNLQAAFGNVGSWFTRQYRTVQGWFAKSRQELARKVQDMVNFLGQIKENMNLLVQGASDSLQGALQNVNNYYTDVVQFQEKVRDDLSMSFESLEEEWKNKVQRMYNGGLDKIVNVAEASKMQVKQRQMDNQIAGGNMTAVSN